MWLGLRESLKSALELARSLPLDELAVFVGEVETIKAIAYTRMCAPTPVVLPDEQVDVATAAQRLGVSETFLYHSHKKLSFTRREGRKLLFSSRGIEAHIKRGKQ